MISTGILLFVCLSSYSQIKLLDAQHFQNPYLANPAMAGLELGTKVNLGYRNQWANIEGAPIDQHFTIDHRMNKVGLGFSVINSRAGDLGHTKAYATYSYAMPLNNQKSKFHFGINFGLQRTSLNAQNIIGNKNDRNVVSFNDRKAILDGDFGLGFTSRRINIDGAIYNLKNQVIDDESVLDLGADFNLMYLGGAYAFIMPEWQINTKVAFRKVKNFRDIIDIGAEVRTSNDKLGFIGIYHTNRSSTFGISYLHQEAWKFLAMYNTTSTPIANYANGSFEVVLQLNLQKLIYLQK